MNWTLSLQFPKKGCTGLVTRHFAEFVEVAVSKNADEVFAVHGIDILPDALALADHLAVPEKFAEHQIRKRLTRHTEHRARKLAEGYSLAAR